MTVTAPTLGTIARTDGVAGQYAYSVVVTYAGEDPITATFMGSTYGGPIAYMIDGGTRGTGFVSAAVTDRIGATLTEEWVRAFYA